MLFWIIPLRFTFQGFFYHPDIKISADYLGERGAVFPIKTALITIAPLAENIKIVESVIFIDIFRHKLEIFGRI